jgi:hypothetical protein
MHPFAEYLMVTFRSFNGFLVMYWCKKLLKAVLGPSIILQIGVTRAWKRANTVYGWLHIIENITMPRLHSRVLINLTVSSANKTEKTCTTWLRKRACSKKPGISMVDKDKTVMYQGISMVDKDKTVMYQGISMVDKDNTVMYQAYGCWPA